MEAQKIKLTDLSLMPFGQYKGKPMQDVPVEYLHWFWHIGSTNNMYAADVMHYIKENIGALEEENEDLIWTRTK